MKQHSPRITIGMPAYNAQEHIAHAIGSITSQTFQDFGLVVSDNASTDATREIVEALAARDDRIQYVRQPTNIGANGNYTFVAREARGEFFKWASSSDWCAPTFLEKCLSRIEVDRDAVIVTPRTRLFQNDLCAAWDYANDIAVVETSPAQRVVDLTSNLRLNNAMNGLIRTSALRRTRLIEPYYGADIVLMGHLAMLGKILLIDEPLFYRRLDPASSTALQDAEGVRKHHYPARSVRMLFQNTKHRIGWFRAAMAAPMPARERVRVLLHAARRMYWSRREIIDDLSDAAQYLRNQISG
jgi:glycosyltransferase involved in cell wall biosynthesis